MAHLNQEAHKIQLRSEEIQEILGTPPSWFTQWGTVVVFAIFLALLGLSFVIKSPDKIQGEFLLKSASTPINIKATIDGQISDLLVKKNQTIKKGTPLFVLQSNAKFKDVQKLENLLTPLAQMDAEMLLTTSLPNDLQLGSLGHQYAELQKAYNNLKTEKSKGFEQFKISTILSKKKRYNKQITEYEKDIEIATKNHLIAQKNLETLKDRFRTDKSITLKMLKTAKNNVSNYLSKILKLKEKQNEIRNTIKNLSNQSTEIRIGKSDKDKMSLEEVRYNANKLLSEIQTWKENYLIKSPIDGKVLFYPDLKITQEFFKTNDTILAVKPKNTSKKKKSESTGHVFVNKDDYDRIEINQPILISLSGHPTMKYGKIIGKVSAKTELLKDNKYIIETKLPNPTITTTGETINIQKELEGTAEIIMDEKSYFYRFFNEIL